MRNAVVPIRHAAGFSALLLLPLTPGTAAAQGSTLIPEITIDVSGVYEDNFARSSDQLAAQRGVDPSDFVVTPSIALNFNRQIGRAEVSLTGTLGYVFHARNSDLNRERIGLSAAGEMPVGPCQIAPTASIQRRQSDLRDIVFINGLGINNAKNTETVQSYGAAIACGRRQGIQPYVAINYQRADNSNPIRERAEYDATTYSGGLRYSSPVVGKISLFGSRRVVDQSPLAVPVGTETSYRFDQVGVEVQRDIGTRITATGSVGYGKLSSDSVLVDRFSGLTWDIELSALIGTSLRLTAGTGREVSNSLASDAGFVVTTPKRVGLAYAFSERLRFQAGAEFTKRRFGYSQLAVPNRIVEEDRQTYDASVSTTLGRLLKLRIYGGHERRNANGTIFDYRANFIGAAIGLSI
jgi:hypothetical protein